MTKPPKIAKARGRIAADMLRELLHYDPISGVFTWKTRSRDHFESDRACAIFHGKYAGKIAGAESDGRVQIRVCGRIYKAHRLAWLYMTGNWPAAEIDHKNCDPADNRFKNLREATSSQNKSNTRTRSDNKSGLKGVQWRPHANKFASQINRQGRTKFIGYFDCPAAAHFAYVIEADQIHGEFARQR